MVKNDLFYDNAVADKNVEGSTENKLYCDCEKVLISGVGDLDNEYIHGNGTIRDQGTAKKKYTITQIRETK